MSINKIAGPEGIEPSLEVLETSVLPLNDRPSSLYEYFNPSCLRSPVVWLFVIF